MDRKGKTIRLIDLFIVFLRIGGFTFGGGYAMLPLIEKDLVEKRKLLTDQEFLDIIAVVQGIPGIIAVNTSLFIGYKLRGIPGALTAVSGITLPSIVIIALIAQTLLNIRQNPIVVSVFSGIRACVVVLIFWAGFKMSKKAIIKKSSILYTIGMIVGMMVFEIHPVILIISAGIIGIVTSNIQCKIEEDTA
ncbi:MAG: chromate transporter [Halanaerobiales bacterium]